MFFAPFADFRGSHCPSCTRCQKQIIRAPEAATGHRMPRAALEGGQVGRVERLQGEAEVGQMKGLRDHRQHGGLFLLDQSGGSKTIMRGRLAISGLPPYIYCIGYLLAHAIAIPTDIGLTPPVKSEMISFFFSPVVPSACS